MKKYLYIYKSEIMTNLQYITDVFISFIAFTLLIFIFLNLWNYIYSDPNEIINGYSKTQMIWYVIITEIMWMSLSGNSLSRKISNDVRSGNIAYNLNKPYNYIEYSLFSHLGLVTMRYIIIGLLGLILGFLFLKTIPNITLLQIPLILLCSILGMIINIILIILISLLSFYIEDAHPFYWLYSKVIRVVGLLFPIEFFPLFLQPIIKFSPIYVICYGPAKLFVNLNNIEFINVIIAQCIYLILSILFCHIIYRKGVRKLNVNGG